MGLKRALYEILRFELLWKLAFLFFLNPLFDGAYQTYVSTAGLSFNGDILWTFLSLKGGVVFLLLFFAAAWLVFYEYSVMIRIAALCRQGEGCPLGQVMRASVWDLGLLRGWSLAAGSIYYILLLPLGVTGYISTAVPHISIPWFVFGEMQKTTLGVVGIVVFQGACYLAHLLLLFVPVDMVLRRRRFGQAVRGSLGCWKQLGWRDRLSVIGLHIVWNWGSTELSRYWRRNLLGNSDFDSNFLKYLFYSEAFRKDLAYWAFLTLLQTVAMAGFIYFLIGVLNRTGTARASLQPAWGRDGAAAWDILTRHCAAWAARWRGRMRTRRWRAATAAVCLALAVSLLLNIQRPLPVHRPMVIAHRGGEGRVENTLEAVLSAAEQGADYAEIDVQLTSDGVPVLFHDSSLWRMAGRGEGIGDLTWEQVQEIPLEDSQYPGMTARIASLEEVLEALREVPGGMGLLIELKPAAFGSEALSNAVIELVERTGFGERAMFMSLDYLCLLPIMERHPEWWTGYCAYSVAGDIDDAVWRYQVDFLAVEEALVSNRLAVQAGELDLPVYVWSVYDSEKMMQYLEMGISGIITDYPAEAVSVLEAYRGSHPGKEYQWAEDGLPNREELGSW